MLLRNAGLPAGVLALALAVGSSCARGQCPGSFAPGFGPLGVTGSVAAMTTYDDGTGAKLYVGGALTAAGSVSVERLASYDGAAWAAVGPGLGATAPSNALISALAVFDDGSGPALYVGGNFSALDGVAANGVVRFNGSAWNPLTGVTTSATVYAMAVYDDGTGPALYLGGSFSFPGGSSSSVARWNGTALAPVGAIQGGVRALAVHDDGSGPALYAGGSDISAAAGYFFNIARWNGSAWAGVGGSVGGCCGHADSVFALQSFDDGTGPALYAGRYGTPLSGHFYRWVAGTWTSLVTPTLPGQSNVSAMAIFDSGAGPALYFAGASVLGVGLTSVARWSPAGPVPIPGAASDIASLHVVTTAAGSLLYAGGQDLRRFDGTSWMLPPQAATIGMTGNVVALGAFDDATGPAVYAGGNFGFAGGVAVSGIGRLQGGAWSPLGSPAGVSGTVTRLLSFHDGVSPALYVAGNFSSAGGITTSPHIARWDGTAWAGVGGGMPGIGGIHDLELHDDGSGPALYAGGIFASAGAVAANHVARWNGASWAPVGSGIDGDIYRPVLTLAVFDDGTGADLYAGGSFVSAGGVPVNGIARWDGAAWLPLGGGVTLTGGLPGGVVALEVFDDGGGPALYAAGNFATAGGVAAAGIARWNGSSWSSLGGTPPPIGTIRTLEVFDDGSGPALFAGGSFPATTGAAGNRLARWNGSAWSAVGSGLGGAAGSYVADLLAFDDGLAPALYAGGSFTSAGGAPSAAIARWDPVRPLVGVFQPGGPGSAVLVGNAGLAAGREYLNVFSAEPCPAGPGKGPYLGLCASNVATLLSQVLLPVGSAPFHFVAVGPVVLHGPYAVPPGLVVDALAIDVTGGVLGCRSPVRRFALP